jgi:S-DNA-T family DNA segregation ATPase FtsK/SpoIIIE
MGLRYRKRIKIAPGIYINISKSGMSTTIGPRGASVNIGRNGTYINAGIPGTGLYERQRIDKTSKSTNQLQDTNSISNVSNTSGNGRIIFGVLSIIFICIVILFNVESGIINFIVLCVSLILIFLLMLIIRGRIEEMDSMKNFNDESDKNHVMRISDVETKDSSINQMVECPDQGNTRISVEPTIEETGFTDLHAMEPYDPKLDLEKYKYPTIDLLTHYDDSSNAIDMEEQHNNKERIKTVLQNFGIDILPSMRGTIGPTITLYEFTLAPGINVSKLRGLEDDIAMALSAPHVRIIAPIPGKGTIGIEVPNVKPSIASIESILNSRKFMESDYELPMALGKTITNEVFMFDLTKAPNILIAGSTGQGKSVTLNAIITSLLYKKHPAELKFVLMDSYGIELGVYSHIANNFLAVLSGEPTIINNSSQAVRTMNSLCKEMDARYNLLRMAQVRTIKDYNLKFRKRLLNSAIGHRFMPYIVVVIDEYGDFITEKGKEFEIPMVRLAQYARAIGIHMIISTKRPTNDIITGSIKTNFPTRISFRVPERIDSQVILDCNGAEELLGNGDMLFKAGKCIDCIRIQGAFVEMPETQDIVSFISRQQSYSSPYLLPDSYYDCEENEGSIDDVDMTHLDPMFEDAARMIVAEQCGSTSIIQRKFSIGYNRAGRLMDQLEKAGIVGPANGSKPREVLCFSEEQLMRIMDNLR